MGRATRPLVASETDLNEKDPLTSSPLDLSPHNPPFNMNELVLVSDIHPGKHEHMVMTRDFSRELIIMET